MLYRVERAKCKKSTKGSVSLALTSPSPANPASGVLAMLKRDISLVCPNILQLWNQALVASTGQKLDTQVVPFSRGYEMPGNSLNASRAYSLRQSVGRTTIFSTFRYIRQWSKILCGVVVSSYCRYQKSSYRTSANVVSTDVIRQKHIQFQFHSPYIESSCRRS